MAISKINGETILAAGVTITDNQLTNATFYIPFVSATSGTDNLEVDSSGLTYNALTNTLTLGAGAGTLSGGATQVFTNSFSGASATYYPTFVIDNNPTAAAETVLTDAGLTYNPSTNILTAVVTNGGGYAAQGRLTTAAVSPTAGVQYYGGGAASAVLSTTVQSRRLYMPKAGTIRSCYGYFFQTASASGNLGTLELNVNNGGYTTVGTAAHNVASTIYSNTGLSIAVAQGNYIEFRWTAPATTAPTNVTSEFIVYVE